MSLKPKTFHTVKTVQRKPLLHDPVKVVNGAVPYIEVFG
jgi:hypothetical protein